VHGAPSRCSDINSGAGVSFFVFHGGCLDLQRKHHQGVEGGEAKVGILARLGPILEFRCQCLVCFKRLDN
jgi:hypothetical protein